MAGLRVASMLVLVALLLNLTVTAALAENYQNLDLTAPNLLSGSEASSPKHFNDLDNNEPKVYEHCTESGPSCFEVDSFVEDSNPRFGNSDAAFNPIDYEALDMDNKVAEASESMVPAKFTTFATATKTAPLAPSTLATFGLSGSTISGWTPPPIVLTTSTQIKKRDITTSTALPCVTTLATYALPGFSLSNWAPPGASCPTTFLTATTSSKR